jgi:hypothetical protein
LDHQQDPFTGLGLLYTLEKVQPNFAGLSEALAQQQALVKNTTITSVRVAKFRSRNDELNFGEVISSYINQRLHDSLGHDIQIV